MISSSWSWVRKAWFSWRNHRFSAASLSSAGALIDTTFGEPGR
jgi:hypothetical protein